VNLAPAASRRPMALPTCVDAATSSLMCYEHNSLDVRIGERAPYLGQGVMHYSVPTIRMPRRASMRRVIQLPCVQESAELETAPYPVLLVGGIRSVYDEEEERKGESEGEG
jgi:hypothetical protein